MSSQLTSRSETTLFVTLSSVLVGLDSSLLAPPLDPSNLAQIYFKYVQKAAAQPLGQLLSTFAVIQSAYPSSQWPAQVQSKILQDSVMGPLARQIIKMWLLGVWFTPPEQSVTGEVISSTAFTRGLLWSVIRAHPTGYSQFSHGYWNTPPPAGPLNQT